jgi:hypothetical protein
MDCRVGGWAMASQPPPRRIRSQPGRRLRRRRAPGAPVGSDDAVVIALGRGSGPACWPRSCPAGLRAADAGWPGHRLPAARSPRTRRPTGDGPHGSTMQGRTRHKTPLTWTIDSKGWLQKQATVLISGVTDPTASPGTWVMPMTPQATPTPTWSPRCLTRCRQARSRARGRPRGPWPSRPIRTGGTASSRPVFSGPARNPPPSWPPTQQLQRHPICP